MIDIYLQCEALAKSKSKDYEETLTSLSATSFKSFLERALVTAKKSWRKRGYISKADEVLIYTEDENQGTTEGNRNHSRRDRAVFPSVENSTVEKSEPITDKELNELIKEMTEPRPSKPQQKPKPKERTAAEQRTEETREKIAQGKIDGQLGRLYLRAYSDPRNASATDKELKEIERQISEAWRRGETEEQKREAEQAAKEAEILRAYEKGEIDEAEKNKRLGEIPF